MDKQQQLFRESKKEEQEYTSKIVMRAGKLMGTGIKKVLTCAVKNGMKFLRKPPF